MVIPNRATFVTAWCYEVALDLASKGNIVYILDLARYETRYQDCSIYWSIDYFQEKNDIRKVFRAVFSRTENIHVINPSEVVSQRFFINLSDSDEQVFNFVARSMYARKFGSRSIEVDDINQNLLSRERKSYSLILSSLREHLKRVKYDAVYTVNGRGLFDSCAITVAKEMQIPYFMIEKTSDNWEYYSIQNISTHSALEVQQKVDEFYKYFKISNSMEIVEVLVRGYYKNPTGDMRLWLNLQSELPDKYKEMKGLVVFFPSSDHEFSTHSDPADLSAPYRTQFEAFQQLAIQCAERGLDLLVRVHPHPLGSVLQVKEDQIWTEICRKYSASIILSKDTTSSLELAKLSHLNVVFTSTIGAEIAYNGLPLLILGDTTYAHLLPASYIRLVKSIGDVLDSPGITTPSDIYPWILYRLFGESRMKHFLIRDFSQVWFQDQQLNSPRHSLVFIIRLLARMKPRREALFSNNREG